MTPRRRPPFRWERAGTPSCMAVDSDDRADRYIGVDGHHGGAGCALWRGMAVPLLLRQPVARRLDSPDRGTGPGPGYLRWRTGARAERRRAADDERALQERQRAVLGVPLDGQGPHARPRSG